jgi:hypothetical protein
VIRPAAASSGTVSPIGIWILQGCVARAISVRISAVGVQERGRWGVDVEEDTRRGQHPRRGADRKGAGGVIDDIEDAL